MSSMARGQGQGPWRAALAGLHLWGALFNKDNGKAREQDLALSPALDRCLRGNYGKEAMSDVSIRVEGMVKEGGGQRGEGLVLGGVEVGTTDHHQIGLMLVHLSSDRRVVTMVFGANGMRLDQAEV